MKNLSLQELSEAVEGQLIGNNIIFSGISIDSRNIKPDNLFWALKGKNFNGNQFALDAIKKGATCLLLDEKIDKNLNVPYVLVDNSLEALSKLSKKYRSNFNVKIAAITGSNGKTTTKFLLYGILIQKYKTLVPQKNYNNEIGLPLTLLELDKEHECVVLEMGATKKGDISYLMQIANPDVVLVTNIGPSHLSTMGGMDGVAQTKSEIYEHLNPEGIAIVNIDEVYAPFMLTKIKGQKIITFGLNKEADVYAKDIKNNSNGISFVLVSNQGNIEVLLPLFGLHNLSNALASVAMAEALGVSLNDIKKGLETFNSVPRRLEILPGINGSTIIDDSYNANPLSVKAALSVLLEHPNKNKVMVFGDMLELGDNAEQIHADIGIFMQKSGITRVLTFGGLTKHTSKTFGSEAKHFSCKNDLIQDLKAILDSDTIVLIKGSNSMKMDEISKNIVIEK